MIGTEHAERYWHMKDFLSVKEAADFLSVHRSAIYQAIKAGHLTPVDMLGKTALRREELETYKPRPYRKRR